MSTPLDEIKRLRAEAAEKDRQLAELRGLVQKHIEATSGDDQRALDALKREKDAFDRGYQHGDEMGWRRGVEHALMAVDEAHWKGEAHDHHGQMRELGLHDGPFPEPKFPEEIVALSERQGRIIADWWFREYQRTHPEPQAQVREMRPKGRDAEREAVQMRTYYAADDEVDNRPFDAADMREIEAQAQRRGITVDQLIEEAGVVRGPDGGLEWRDPNPGEHAEMRYAYDERDIFRTEDPLAIELGNRVTEGLALENGTDDYERNQAQVFIRTDAMLASAKAMNRETERQLADTEQRLADNDRWLARMEMGE